MAPGVVQQSLPRLEMLSQLPPDAVYTAELKLKLVPALTTGRTCGKGFAPPSSMTKLMAFCCLKTFGPTTTPMGIVTTSFAAVNTNWPLNVPAVRPWPGRFLVTTETVTVEGAFPDRK